jgi:hypothetical protein
VFRVYDEAGNVIETHEHKGDFKEDLPLRTFCTFNFCALWPVAADLIELLTRV